MREEEGEGGRGGERGREKRCVSKGEEGYLWPIEIDQRRRVIGDLQQLEYDLEVGHASAGVRGRGVGEEAEDGVHVCSDHVQSLLESFTLLVDVLSTVCVFHGPRIG